MTWSSEGAAARPFLVALAASAIIAITCLLCVPMKQSADDPVGKPLFFRGGWAGYIEAYDDHLFWTAQHKLCFGHNVSASCRKWVVPRQPENYP